MPDIRAALRASRQHPAAPDGQPAAIQPELGLDRLGLLRGVATFNRHPHLPHLERLGRAVDNLDVLARQPVDPGAPAHPFTAEGRFSFDALLPSRPETFHGVLLISDTPLFSSTAGGATSLNRLWTNLVRRSDCQRRERTSKSVGSAK
jgi:hypothetical protein